VLIAGCTFDDGTSYKLEVDLPAAPKPSWFGDVIRAAKKDRVANAGESAIDLDKPSQVAWARDYLVNDAEPSIEGEGGEQTTFKIACSLKENGISQSKAFELMMEFYNVEFVCEPLWEPDDLEKKIGNAYAYASLAVTGGKSAEAEFMADPAEIAEVAASITVDEAAVAERKALAAIDAERAATDQAERIWTKPEVVESFIWCVGLERMIKIDDPRIMWKKSAFDSKFAYHGKNGKGFADSLLSKKKGTIRRFDELAYMPMRPPIIGDKYNTWRPSKIVAAPGDTSVWDAHLAYLFPDEVDRNHLLNWLAGVLQHQDIKPKHALLMIGKDQGTGKSFVSAVFSALLGDDNCQTLTQDILHASFTGWALRTKLVIVEELRAIDRAELKGKLHVWITEAGITINEKNIPTFKLDQVLAMFLMSNKEDAVEVDNTDRRYLVLQTKATPHRDQDAYYSRLYALLADPIALGAIMHQLMTRDLGDYKINGRAPDTAAKARLKNATANEVTQYMMENSGMEPFSYRVVTLNEIREALPRSIQNRASLPKLREAMEFCGAVPWHKQIRPRGFGTDKLRVWLQCDTAKRKDLQSIEVIKMYRDDRDERQQSAADRAETEFGFADDAPPISPDVIAASSAASTVAMPDPWD
jgi:hypothetical protein